MPQRLLLPSLPYDMLRFCLALFALSAVVSAQKTHTFKSNASIDEYDRTYAGYAIIVDGATVAIEGQHTFASVRLINGGQLTHSPGQPKGIHLIVAGDVEITAGCAIDVRGRGYVAGDGPGRASWTGRASDGAGHGGRGASRGILAPGGRCYGSIAEPTTLGSSGTNASSRPHGLGGGHVRIIAGRTLRVDGSILAGGLSASTSGSGGSGGSIWLTVPTIAGAGRIDAGGADGRGGRMFGAGGGGRISLEFDEWQFTAGRVQAYGGRDGDGWQAGAGTIFLRNRRAQTAGLRIDNGDRVGRSRDVATTDIPTNTVTDANVEISGHARVAAAEGTHGLYWTIRGDLTIDSHSQITMQGRGFSIRGPGRVPEGSMSGASFGGRGGRGWRGLSGTIYGSATEPLLPGSTGEQNDGAGGAIILTVSGTTRVDGVISADGPKRDANDVPLSGRGTGGTLRLHTPRLMGNGRLRADAGRAAAVLCGGLLGGGGGGRIAVYADRSQFRGSVTVKGGGGFSSCGRAFAQDGTIRYGSWPGPLARVPELLGTVDNFDRVVASSLPDRPWWNKVAKSNPWGSAGAWGFYPWLETRHEPLATPQSIAIVKSATFDPTRAGNSLLVQTARTSAVLVTAQLEQPLLQRAGRIHRISAQVWVPASANGDGGCLRLMSGGNPHGLVSVFWNGGSVESNGRAWQPFQADTWQRVVIELNLAAATYDLMWSPLGQPLKVIASNLPVTRVRGRPYRDVGSIALGGSQSRATKMFVDQIEVSEQCVSRVTRYGAGLGGTKGIPGINATVVRDDVDIVLGNSRGAATPAFLAIGVQEIRAPLPWGGNLLVAPTSLPLITLPASGLTVRLPGFGRTLCGVRLLFQTIQLDPGAPAGVAVSRGLRVDADR